MVNSGSRRDNSNTTYPKSSHRQPPDLCDRDKLTCQHRSLFGNAPSRTLLLRIISEHHRLR
jgi:hypothetical protein